MPRRHGYSPVGQWCFGKLDGGAKGRTNVIGALLSGLLLSVTLLTSNVNSEVFYTWITPKLLPQLSNQGVVVMDNASFHQRYSEGDTWCGSYSALVTTLFASTEPN